MKYRDEIDSIIEQILIHNKFEIDLNKFENIVITGMGGSGIAGKIASEIYSEKPLIAIDSYNCPNFVNELTLFIAVSYSGNTEETLSCAMEAKNRGARIFSITSGGALKNISDFTITIPQGYQPRSAIGFLLMPIVNSLMPNLSDDIQEIASTLKSVREKEDEIKLLAKEIYNSGKTPYFISWSPTRSVAYRCKTQFNENSKSFASSGSLSEMDHNELVPMGMEKKIDPFFYIAFINTFSKRNYFRLELSKKLSGLNIKDIELKGNSALSQILYGVYYGDILSYHVALLKGIDPKDVSILENLKKNLSSQ
ncbi:MAG: bifunctional phosphoglucose/phosphomannose isomerase [Thermoplasmataceae archaeon]